MRATITRGIGSSSNDRPVPSHGSRSLADSSLVNGLVSTMPGCARIASTTAAVSRSRSRPGVGRTCTVISLPTSDCHSAADSLTRNTPPVVIEARKVMIATTATSARPAIEARGTIGETMRACAGNCGRSSPRSTNRPCSSRLLIDVQASLVQHQPAGLILVHQRDVVGCDDDGGTRAIKLDEQAQKTAAERRIVVVGWFVCLLFLW